MDWDDVFDWVKATGALILVLGLLSLIPLVIYGMIQDERQWKAFSIQHHCHIVGKKDSSIAPGVSSSGKFTTTYIDSQTGYGCDDGITYWRDD